MSKPQFSVVEKSPSYWTVTFENGPVNLLDADSIEELADLVARIEQDPALTVVVFDSANADYFMAHWDSHADKQRVAAMTPGPTGLHPYLDNFVRLSKVPAVTISSIRGRVRGAGSEFVLATDIRFAGDRAILDSPRSGSARFPVVALWPGLRASSAAVVLLRSCWARTTSPQSWPRNTATSIASCPMPTWPRS